MDDGSNADDVEDGPFDESIAAFKLPRSVGDIYFPSPGRIALGMGAGCTTDVLLTANGGAIILAHTHGEPVADELRRRIFPIDIIEALNDFRIAAARELGHEVEVIAVGHDTIAQLLAARVVRPRDITEELLRHVDGMGVWEITLLAADTGLDSMLTLRFSLDWSGMRAVAPVE